MSNGECGESEGDSQHENGTCEGHGSSAVEGRKNGNLSHKASKKIAESVVLFCRGTEPARLSLVKLLIYRRERERGRKVQM